MIARCLAVLLLLGLLPGVARADPDALWKIVHGKCVPDEAQSGSPKPCEAVDLKGGYALLKDLVGNTQFLLIPTEKVTGIEDAAVLAPDAPNYFADAWAMRGHVDARAGRSLPRDAIALAINSPYGRSQNQLHIHIDCLVPEVRAALAQHAPALGSTWSPLRLAGHDYRAMRLNGETLTVNPFDVLADTVPGAREDMAHHTLVLAGASFAGQPGFILLDDRAGGLDRGSGEELQDHGCALLKDLP